MIDPAFYTVADGDRPTTAARESDVTRHPYDMFHPIVSNVSPSH